MPRLTLKQKRMQAEREFDALMALELLLIASICFTPSIGGFVSFGKSLVTFLGFYFAEFVSVGINEASLFNNLFFNFPKAVYSQITGKKEPHEEAALVRANDSSYKSVREKIDAIRENLNAIEIPGLKEDELSNEYTIQNNPEVVTEIATKVNMQTNKKPLAHDIAIDISSAFTEEPVNESFSL